MSTKRRSRQDMYARLISYITDCLAEARAAIKEVANEEYLPQEYKQEYRRMQRRVEEKLEKCTSEAVRWKDAIKNVDLEYVIQLNALYNAMMSEFEFFEIRPQVLSEIEKEIKRVSTVRKMDTANNVYEKTMADYTDSLCSLAEDLREYKIIRRPRCLKYSQFDTRAFNVQLKELYEKEGGIVSNEVFNSYKLDSLSKKRSFSYIKTLVQIIVQFQAENDGFYSKDLYLMSYTTPRAMVSFKLNPSTLDIYSEIRVYDKESESGYKEATLPIKMQTDMYKIYENFGFSIRQRSDASLKFHRICEIIDKYEE